MTSINQQKQEKSIRAAKVLKDILSIMTELEKELRTLDKNKRVGDDS